MLLNRTYIRCEEIVSRNVLGETILVPVKGEMAKLADMQKIFSLNTVAEFIWNALDGQKNLRDILFEMIQYFDIDENTAKNDLVELIDELITYNLISEVK